MRELDVVQGSPEWHAARAKCFTASEAPAMLGLSKYQNRADLLKQKALGIVEEVDEATQARFNRGHQAEAMARPIVEQRIGQELFPVTATDDDGRLLASFDGLTMLGDVVWENKLMNADFLAFIQSTGDIPDTHWPQVEQQLLISGAARAYFTVSDGTEEGTHGIWYESKPERRQRLLAGWAQFEIDLKNYQHVEVIPAAVAAPIKELPTLFVQARGEVTSTNMPVFKAQVTEFLATINLKPATDQEFADGKEVAKKLRELAVKIKERKADMLAQTASIGEVAVEIDHLAEVINANALELEKAVKREEDARKLAIVSGGRTALADHIASLNARLGKPYMPNITADFAEAIKSKRLITAMQEAVSTLLANKKLEANEIADRIDANLKTLRELAADHVALFPDTSTIVLKANDDLAALVKTRIAEHKAEIERKAEQERERIRQEEQAKIKREAEAAEARRECDEQAAQAQARAAEESAKPAPVAKAVETIEPVQTAASVTQALSEAPKQPCSRRAVMVAEIVEMLAKLDEANIQKVSDYVAHMVDRIGERAAA